MSDKEDPVLKMVDVRATGGCVAGLRQWCNRNGRDVRTFVNGGYRASDAEATGDAYAIRLAVAARKRVSEDG